MPLYEYQCESCAHRFERIQKYSDPLIDTCPKCGGPVKKLFSSPAVHFKGSGFYITDYAKKPASGEGKPASGGKEGGDAGGGGSSDTAAKESKPTDTSSPAPSKKE